MLSAQFLIKRKENIQTGGINPKTAGGVRQEDKRKRYDRNGVCKKVMNGR